MHGLIFDVDGVISDTETVNARASIQVFVDLFDLHGVKREDFAAGLGRGAEAYMQAAATANGLTLSDEQLEQATARRQENFLAILASEPLPAFPGVLELLSEAMDDDDWDVAIATSSTREKSEAVLTAAGFPYHELVYLTGSDVKKKKPDPELFVTAAGRMGIPPDRCVVIEDAPNGVQAALAGGCACCAVTNSVAAEALREADLVVPSLAGITLKRLGQLLA